MMSTHLYNCLKSNVMISKPLHDPMTMQVDMDEKTYAREKLMCVANVR